MILPDLFQTARLTIRPIVPSDGRAIFDSYAQDAEVTRFLTWRPHRTIEDTDEYIAYCLAAPSEIGRTYVLTDRKDGAIRGGFDFALPGAASTGVWLCPGTAVVGNGIDDRNTR